jgi:transposase
MKQMEGILDILVLKRQGFSNREIARRMGVHRSTVKKYLTEGIHVGEVPRYGPRGSKLDFFENQIKAWIENDHLNRATLIYDRLCKVGFDGSYEIVKRRVSQMKSDAQRIAYIRFETEPGHQAQVDFGEFQVIDTLGNVRKYYLFAMILGYSRYIYAELVERCDLVTFLDCHIRAFAFLGGVPEEIVYDRMRNVYRGLMDNQLVFNPELTKLALHYSFKPVVAPAYSPWVKGKIERPMDFIREGFWRGYSFINLKTGNHDLLSWLVQKAQRIHGTTHERVDVRFEYERSFLRPLPKQTLDTSYKVFRKVHKDCTVCFEGNRYVVPHHLVGHQIILRVKEKILRVFDNECLVVTYAIPDGKGQLIQDKRFYEALRQDWQMNKLKYGVHQHLKGRAQQTISPTLPKYDLEVQIRPIATYDRLYQETTL